MKTEAERFNAKYAVDAETGCWIWTAAISHGYGVFRSAAGPTIRAHQWMWERHFGPVPEGLELDHLCRNPSCCNPEHLEAVTHRENVLRGAGVSAANATKTHCVKGHALTPENVYHPPKRPSQRHCKECKQLRAAS